MLVQCARSVGPTILCTVRFIDAGIHTDDQQAFATDGNSATCLLCPRTM